MITIIAAIAENNVIGKNNTLPWHLPEDLKRFKKLTSGNTVLMGRKTFESILNSLGKPLPNRKNVVITRNIDYKVPEGVTIYNNLEQAFDELKNENIFVIGGAEIYKQALPLADRLEITHLEQNYPGDTYFPEIDFTNWKIIDEEKYDNYKFVTYIKI